MSLTVRVVGAVFERDGAFLACRRAEGKADAGLWEFPGGKVEANETPAEALSRELREELACPVQIGDLVDRSTTRVGERLIDLATYRVVPIGDLPNTSTDHDELRWVSRERLGSLVWARPDLPTVAVLGRQTPMRDFTPQ